MIISIDLEAEVRSVAMYRQIWLTEKKKLDADVRKAGEDKTALPNNYWLDEHQARRKYEMAAALLNELAQGD